MLTVSNYSINLSLHFFSGYPANKNNFAPSIHLIILQFFPQFVISANYSGTKDMSLYFYWRCEVHREGVNKYRISSHDHGSCICLACLKLCCWNCVCTVHSSYWHIYYLQEFIIYRGECPTLIYPCRRVYCEVLT